MNIYFNLARSVSSSDVNCASKARQLHAPALCQDARARSAHRRSEVLEITPQRTLGSRFPAGWHLFCFVYISECIPDSLG